MVWHYEPGPLRFDMWKEMSERGLPVHGEFAQYRCDGCENKITCNYRWNSKEDSNFDLCPDCYLKSKKKQTFKQIEGPSDEELMFKVWKGEQDLLEAMDGDLAYCLEYVVAPPIELALRGMIRPFGHSFSMLGRKDSFKHNIYMDVTGDREGGDVCGPADQFYLNPSGMPKRAINDINNARKSMEGAVEFLHKLAVQKKKAAEEAKWNNMHETSKLFIPCKKQKTDA